jgi:ATP-dependent DNA helicase RecG
LEGDVGSGKTAVAAAGIYAALLNNKKSIVMAPTQILAEQHFKTISQLLPKTKVELITSATKKFDKDASVFIGTHALLHKKIDFSDVSFVVIDEQHRFGVEQRSHLVNGKNTPHILTMTATPIPRTVALTTYGDLDLSVLTDMPAKRQKITTWVIPEEKRKGAYDWINKQLTTYHTQAFIVCPLIDVSEHETMKDIKSVLNEFESLKKIFKKQKLGLLHGKLKPSEKNKVLDDFRNKKIDILVTTPVVEVGIDIPNATIMMIEASERFGLAQLHQLRGRVGRGDKKSYCLLFSNIKYSKRLKAMEKESSGFELAEIDLKLRGPGEIFGTHQSGFPELKVASWNNYEMIHDAKEVAKVITQKPKEYPELFKNLKMSTV